MHTIESNSMPSLGLSKHRSSLFRRMKLDAALEIGSRYLFDDVVVGPRDERSEIATVGRLLATRGAIATKRVVWFHCFVVTALVFTSQ